MGIARQKQLFVRMTDSELDSVKRAAELNRLTVADYVRTCVFLDMRIFEPKRDAKDFMHSASPPVRQTMKEKLQHLRVKEE